MMDMDGLEDLYKRARNGDEEAFGRLVDLSHPANLAKLRNSGKESHARRIEKLADRVFEHGIRMGRPEVMIAQADRYNLIYNRLWLSMNAGIIGQTIGARRRKTAERLYQQAAKTYREQAEAGDVEACIALGLLYVDGIGVAQDFDQASYWCTRAKTLGNSRGLEALAERCFKLGEHFHGWYDRQDGWNTRCDWHKALLWHERAAALGDTRSMVLLAKYSAHFVRIARYALNERADFLPAPDDLPPGGWWEILPRDVNTAVEWLEQAASAGNTEANLILWEGFATGRLLENDIPRDKERARIHLEKTGRFGGPDAVAGLSVDSKEVCLAERFHWYRWANDHDNGSGLLDLVEMSLGAEEGAPDLDEALWLCHLHNSLKCKRPSQLIQQTGSPGKRRRRFWPSGWLLLGRVHAEILGDQVAASQCYENYLDFAQYSDESLVEMARLHMTGRGDVHDPATALAMLRTCQFFGLTHGVDETFQSFCADVVPNLRNAAKAGDVEAMNNLAFVLRYGLDGHQDWLESCRLYRVAAALGDTEAMVRLGDFLRIKDVDSGVDGERPEQWFVKGGLAGSFNAIWKLNFMPGHPGNSAADCVVYGVLDKLSRLNTWVDLWSDDPARDPSGRYRNVLKTLLDPAERDAIPWRVDRLIAEALFDDDQIQALTGPPRATDRERYREAMDRLGMAAGTGDRGAMFKLALALETGLAGETDRRAARGWFRKSAEAGDPVAMIYTGILLHQDGAQPKDKETRPEVWFTRAALANCQQAISHLGILAGKLEDTAGVYATAFRLVAARLGGHEGRRILTSSNGQIENQEAAESLAEGIIAAAQTRSADCD